MATKIGLNATGHNPGGDSFTQSLAEHDKGCKCQLCLKFVMGETSSLSEPLQMCELAETSNTYRKAHLSQSRLVRARKFKNPVFNNAVVPQHVMRPHDIIYT